MPRRARIALIGAVTGVALMAVIWYLAHDVAVLRHADASILGGFLGLHRSRLDRVTQVVASLCDPVPYVLFAAVPVLVALVRGRARLALTLFVIVIGANETTEILKPLLAGARDPVAGVLIGNASWPSGHATAAMSLALCAVLCAPARRRPAVGAVMAAFCVAVCYSFLELGWHYPSDALGGFLVASTWTLLGIAGLSTYEAHRPALARGAAARGPSPAFSIGQALGPPVTIVLVALLFAAVITAARPHAVLAYAAAHATFVVGAAAIGALSFALAAGLNLMLRRPSQ